MSDWARATLTSKQESVFNGTNLTRFEFTASNVGRKSSTFELHLVDQHFEIVWTINRKYYRDFCEWTGIKLKKANKKFFGHFKIKFPQETSIQPRSFSGTFDSSLQIQASFNDTKNKCSFESELLIEIEIYHEDQWSHSNAAYEKLWESKRFADFKFIVGGEKIQVHQDVLASRNKVFDSMFSADMMERRTGEAEIKDEDSGIFKSMLRFIYCGKLDCSDVEVLVELMLVADKYSVQILVNLCAYRISGKLTVDNVVKILHVTDLVNVTFLKKKCAAFIKKKQR